MKNHRKFVISNWGVILKGRWTRLFSAAETEGFLFGSGVVAERWECLVCATDFRPMFAADHGARDSDFLYHCERCGASACFKCTLRCLRLNPLHETSVGFGCIACNFYNCNRISNPELPSAMLVDAFPFCSGYSTLLDSKVKGEKLPTSKAIASNADHGDNMLRQAATYDVFLTEHRDDLLERNVPRSPDYDPTDPNPSASYYTT